MIIESLSGEYGKYVSLLDKTLAQLDEAELFVRIHSERNSIAVILKHISGNLISRLTNFLSEDGEKEWRNRDGEFEIPEPAKAPLLAQWERAKQVVLDELGKLRDEDLGKTVSVRGEKMPAIHALIRNLPHLSYHAGQIVFIAKVLKGRKWQNQSIPLGKSGDFNKSFEPRTPPSAS